MIDEALSPVGMTIFGDWFFEAWDGRVYFLDLVSGALEEIAESRSEFLDRRGLPANLDRWYMADLALLCLENGLVPAEGQCLGFKVPPVLGGELDLENIEVCGLAVHQSLMGQLHRQVKDLPDGAVISGLNVEEKKT